MPVRLLYKQINVYLGTLHQQDLIYWSFIHISLLGRAR